MDLLFILLAVAAFALAAAYTRACERLRIHSHD
jgi:hypothetical protein